MLENFNKRVEFAYEDIFLPLLIIKNNLILELRILFGIQIQLTNRKM